MPSRADIISLKPFFHVRLPLAPIYGRSQVPTLVMLPSSRERLKHASLIACSQRFKRYRVFQRCAQLYITSSIASRCYADPPEPKDPRWPSNPFRSPHTTTTRRLDAVGCHRMMPICSMRAPAPSPPTPSRSLFAKHFQNRSVSSPAPVTTVCPSGLIARYKTL